MTQALTLHHIPRVGIGIIVLQNDKILLGQRKGAHGSGFYSPPGGHLEYKETVSACACRELQEETGLTALAMKLGPWTEDLIENDRHYISLFVFVKKFEGTLSVLEPHKCESWGWYGWKELPVPLFKPLASLIEKVGIDGLACF